MPGFNSIDHENKFYTNVQTAVKITVFEYDGDTPGEYSNLQHPIPTQYRFLNIWNYSIFRVSIYDREGHQLAEVAPKSQNYFNAYIGSPSSDLYFNIIWQDDYMKELYQKYNVTGTGFRVVASDVPLLEPLSLMSDLLAMKNTENLDQIVDNGVNIKNPDDLKDTTALQPNYFSQNYNTLIGIIDPANPTGTTYNTALEMDYTPSNPIFSGSYTTNDFYIAADNIITNNECNVFYSYEWFNSYNVANFFLNYFNNIVISSTAGVTDLESLMNTILKLQKSLAVNVNIQGLNLYYQAAAYCKNQLSGASATMYNDTTVSGYGAQFVGDFNIAGMATPINDGYDNNMMQIYCNQDTVTNFTPYLNTVKLRNINGITAPTFMTMCASIGLSIDSENLTDNTKPGIFQLAIPFNTTPSSTAPNFVIIESLLECYALNDVESARTILAAGLIGNDALYFYDYCNKICYEYMTGMIHEQLRYAPTSQEIPINPAMKTPNRLINGTNLSQFNPFLILNGILITKINHDADLCVYSLTTNKKINNIKFSTPMAFIANTSDITITERNYNNYFISCSPQYQWTLGSMNNQIKVAIYTNYNNGYSLSPTQSTIAYQRIFNEKTLFEKTKLNRVFPLFVNYFGFNITIGTNPTMESAINYTIKLEGTEL